jgi:lipopolysaccharide assembly LptE-like protein
VRAALMRRRSPSPERHRLFGYAAFALALLSACGYHVTGTQVALPPDVRSLGVGTISNFSREYGLEKTLAFALQREIMVRRQFRMSEEVGTADAVVNGAIRDVTARPVAFGANDVAVLYEIALTLDVSLTRQRDGHVLWQVNGLRELNEYSASPTTVITSSSQFQQETLNATDINNPQFNSVQLAETLRRQAITRLVTQVVRDVYNQMVEDF